MIDLKKIIDLINPGLPPDLRAPEPTLPQDLFFKFAKNILLPAIGVLAVLVIIYGGVLYVTAGANEEQSAKAKRTLLYGIIGLVLVIASFAIYKFIIGI